MCKFYLTMPVTTRAQKRKFELQEAAELECITKCGRPAGCLLTQPGPEFFPDFVYHDLANDKQLQRDLYDEDFHYDFSGWPHSFWMKPKYLVSGFIHSHFSFLFYMMKLPQLFSHAYRHFNPRMKIDVEIEFDTQDGMFGSYEEGAIDKNIRFDCKNIALDSEVSDIHDVERELTRKFDLMKRERLDVYGYWVHRITQVTITQSPEQ